MKFWSFPIIRICPFLVIGIVSYRFLFISPGSLLGLVGIGLILLFILNLFLKQRLVTYSAPDLLSYLLFSICGFLLAYWHDPLNHNTHYTNFLKETDSVYSIEARIDEALKTGRYNFRYQASLVSINDLPCKGKILINIPLDSIKPDLGPNDIIKLASEFRPIRPPRNPHQFNYKDFMANRGVYHNIYIETGQISILGKQNNLFSSLKAWREQVIETLDQFDIPADEKGVILALLLGQRQEISSELYERYAQSGAVHILAISGLHIGIILMLLQYLLKPLDLVPLGPKFRVILILAILWMFALITGLSPSVCRAATMFSLFSISMNLNRPANSFNTLALSMLVLLLFNPNFLYEIGFQLSYLAVLSILLFNPVLAGLWRPKHILVRYPLQILCVSLSAQIGVLPLSLYYFNQFPGLFFISNLVLIPFLGLILCSGFIIIGLATFDLLNDWLIEIYVKIIELMNSFVSWVSGFEEWIIEQIPFNLSLVILCYVLIISIHGLIYSRSMRYIGICLIAFIIYRADQFVSGIWKPANALVIFHKSRETILGLKLRDELMVSATDTDSIWNNTIINDFALGEGIRHTKTDSLRSFYTLPQGNLLIIDSLPVYKLRSSKVDWVFLRNSPRLNLDRLIDSLQPKQLICDGSNYRSYRQRWKQSCRNKKIPFHSTDERGAFIIRF